MDRKTKNLRRKIQISLDQIQASIQLREEELENIEVMKSLAKKKDQDTDHFDRKIARKKEGLKKLRSDEKITKDELKKLD